MADTLLDSWGEWSGDNFFKIIVFPGVLQVCKQQHSEITGCECLRVAKNLDLPQYMVWILYRKKRFLLVLSVSNFLNQTSVQMLPVL